MATIAESKAESRRKRISDLTRRGVAIGERGMAWGIACCSAAGVFLVLPEAIFATSTICIAWMIATVTASRLLMIVCSIQRILDESAEEEKPND